MNYNTFILYPHQQRNTTAINNVNQAPQANLPNVQQQNTRLPNNSSNPSIPPNTLNMGKNGSIFQ